MASVSPAKPAETAKPAEEKYETQVLSTGVKVTTKRPGNGVDYGKKGQQMRIQYTVRVQGGEVFDSSRERGPFIVRLGAGLVLPGLEDALEVLSYREVAEIVVPPQRAYGPRGYPPMVPPDSLLVYEVEVLAIEGH